ncbi:hypothetical protein FC99_GL000555 [Levilactobacillus koreensis JCM 16448]|nr:hypothetical protein FC99_GL000555 [Levilactobacillus koreensis JCM 16448]
MLAKTITMAAGYIPVLLWLRLCSITTNGDVQSVASTNQVVEMVAIGFFYWQRFTKT